MLQQGPSLGPIDVFFLSQIDGEIEEAPLASQPDTATISAQAAQVAARFEHFVVSAQVSLDICIYDFRLDLPEVRDVVVDAINHAADQGVKVRIAYDQAQQAGDGAILKLFHEAGGDPAPVGTEHFLNTVLPLEHENVEARPVAEEAIASGGQIMHQKYMVRDAGTDGAAVWMGSANFTVDAWALQENNIAVFTSCQDLAAKYEQDFTDLWTSESLAGTGHGDQGSVTVGSQEVSYAFAPGQGPQIEALIASTISGAQSRLRLASMVTSSEDILRATKAKIDAGIDFRGVYDFGETDQVRNSWQQHPSPTSDRKLALLDAVTTVMVAKHSLLFDRHHPDFAHNFMHNKAVVADDKVIFGSFNFSRNATRNAENVILIENHELADAYADYIGGLAARYGVPAVAPAA
jgi:phosphatidylserine/phosphatidylglycerophosphate/cardiolipin synthase-like enzyme